MMQLLLRNSLSWKALFFKLSVCSAVIIFFYSQFDKLFRTKLLVLTYGHVVLRLFVPFQSLHQETTPCIMTEQTDKRIVI